MPGRARVARCADRRVTGASRSYNLLSGAALTMLRYLYGAAQRWSWLLVTCLLQVL